MGFLGLFTRNAPKIKVESTKRDGFSGWVKCSSCQEMIHANEMTENLNCCPKCSYHYRFTAKQRIDLLADEDSFQELFTNLKPTDPLKFEDTETYLQRTQRAQKKTGRDEGAYVGVCTVNGKETALGVMDFSYMGGSMGSVVGEKLTRIIEYATENHLPVVIVCSSGGARMQESCLSLMQMAKTSAALARHRDQKLPYISILTNPTTGGVTASFASLGDIIMAEPDALIGFAGPRVVEQTIKHKLPPTAQKSEFLLERGMIDCIVTREEMKDKLSFFLEFLHGNDSLDKKADLTRAKGLPLPSELSHLIDIANNTQKEKNLEKVKAKKA